MTKNKLNTLTIRTESILLRSDYDTPSHQYNSPFKTKVVDTVTIVDFGGMAPVVRTSVFDWLTDICLIYG